MSARIDDGGPAFPLIEPPTECNVSEGMSLRDHFAGLAMSGLLAAGRDAQYGDSGVVDLAIWSYRIADQMITARAAS